MDSPQGFAFSSDGSKMFMTGRERDKVQEFNLSTPFDLSNVTQDRMVTNYCWSN